ncbi:hypothetical protein ACQEVB_18335 [Pseudonocardia sp. CA-107938]|uniref:hypothetical protein n=1 Tax=Pseudonocardia sp. CA-107938 TaxID=3240021 RepID=UPI003D8EBBC7
MPDDGSPTDPGAIDPWGAPPPAPLGSAAAGQAVSDIAAPVLAGFVVTLIGVVAQNPESFLLPGLAIVVMLVAMIAFVVSVTCGFRARQFLWTRADLLAWYDGPIAAALDGAYRAMHRRDIATWARWRARVSASYNVGIVALFLGVALVCLPPARYGGEPVSGTEAVLRYVAGTLAAGAGVGELFWWVYRRRRTVA